jgi:hypothetical protein
MSSSVPPTIPGDIAPSSISIASNLKTSTESKTGFYGAGLVVQQEPPTPVINPTLETLNTQLQDIIVSLTNYGLMADSESPPPEGRTVTFTNSSSDNAITVYLTVGAPTPSGPTLLATLAMGESLVWDIPEVKNYSGNFSFWHTGSGPAAGSSLFEFGFNQKWKGIAILRDTFDISNVPPGPLPSYLNNGPRADCVAYSKNILGYSTQQSRGYSVGLQIETNGTQTPPALATQTVLSNVDTGDSAESVGFPNDTSYPKQQSVNIGLNYVCTIVDVVNIDI